jgi:hypothetical protein
VRWQVVRQSLAVLGGLNFHTDEWKSFLLGFNNSGRPSVYIKEIVRESVSGYQRKISEDDAPSGVNVSFLVVLDFPASLLQGRINLLAR